MPQLPGDFTNLLKDGLRGARYVFRRGTRFGQETVALSPAVPRIARLADSVLNVTEKAAAALKFSEPQDFEDPAAFMDMFRAMLAATDKTQVKQSFIRIHYLLAEAVLRRLGVENAFISAHEMAAAYDVLRSRHRKTLLALMSKRDMNTGAIIRFWVSAAVCLGNRHPIREIDLPKEGDVHTQFLEQAPATYCLLIVALTGAILTTRHMMASPGGEAPPDNMDAYIDSAVAVVTARFDRLAAHFSEPDVIEVLVPELETVMPFLP